MSKNSLSFVIKGEPVTKKNSSQIKYRYNRKLGKSVPIIVPSESYNTYREYALYQLNRVTAAKDFKTIDYPINLKCVYYKSDLRVCDITNLMSATHDILEDAGIIKEDSWKVVDSVDGTRIKFDEDNPRVEVFITPSTREDTTFYLSNKIRSKRELEKKEKILIREEERERKRLNTAKKVIKLRDVDGLTYKEIAEIVNLSPSTVSKYYKKYSK